MGFESLLGNTQLKENLRASVGRGRLSHFYLICGPAGSGKRTLARLLAAAALCRGEDKPCMACAACRKVFSGVHPDFITVDEPDKVTVPVEVIRRARADIYVRPNEADRKVYLFPRGQDIGIAGQNALLKVLEEPPEYGVFLLLTDNPDRLLPTVRSRATELTLRALPEEIACNALSARFPEAEGESIRAAAVRSGGYLGQAAALLEQGSGLSAQTEEFIRCFAAKDTMGLLRLLVSMEEGWKRDAFAREMQQWAGILGQALTCRCGMPAAVQAARQLSSARSSRELMQAQQHLCKAAEYAQGNVSVATICGHLEWALR